MANTYGQPIDLFSTTLNGAITAAATTMTVASVGSLVVNTYLVIEPTSGANKEIVYVTNINGLVLTITRGIGDTSGKAHADGVAITQPLVSSVLDDLKANLEAYEDTALATKPALVAAGTDGLAAANNGTATDASRSDHTHPVFVARTTRTAAQGTGNQAITGVGFAPQMVMIYAVVGSATAPGCHGISHGSGTSSSNRFSKALCSFDSGAEHEVRALTKGNRIVYIEEEDGTDGVETDLISLDADGFTVNWVYINHTCTFMYICYG